MKIKELTISSNFKFHLVATIAAMLAPQSILASVMHWDPATGGNGHYYELVSVPEGIYWSEAFTAANSAGGYLATITSADENQFVYGIAASNLNAWYRPDAGTHGPWLGGFQPDGSQEPDGGWQWVNSEGTFTYTNWYPGEPNNTYGAEKYLTFEGLDVPTSDLWNDLYNQPLLGYVVEYNQAPVPIPATVWLFGSALAGFLGINRRKDI